MILKKKILEKGQYTDPDGWKKNLEGLTDLVSGKFPEMSQQLSAKFSCCQSFCWSLRFCRDHDMTPGPKQYNLYTGKPQQHLPATFASTFIPPKWVYFNDPCFLPPIFMGRFPSQSVGLICCFVMIGGSSQDLFQWFGSHPFIRHEKAIWKGQQPYLGNNN